MIAVPLLRAKPERKLGKEVGELHPSPPSWSTKSADSTWTAMSGLASRLRSLVKPHALSSCHIPQAPRPPRGPRPPSPPPLLLTPAPAAFPALHQQALVPSSTLSTLSSFSSRSQAGVPFVHHLALRPAPASATGCSDRLVAGAAVGGGRGLGTTGSRGVIIRSGRNARGGGVRVEEERALDLWSSWGAVVPSVFLLERGDKSLPTQMATAVAAGCCTGSFSSMCASTGSRSNHMIRRTLFSEDSPFVRANGGRSFVTESGSRFSRQRIAPVVGLSGGGSLESGVRFPGSKVVDSSRDRTLLVGASASSSASSVPGISYTEPLIDEGDGGNGFSGGRGGGGGGGGGGGDNGHGGSESSGAGHGGSSIGGGGFLSAFLNGWRSRVQADPQFPFKVLTEEIIGVGACVLGDMASRPNFGLDELDLVFSTIVVGSILNFTLMYMLAPTSAMGAVATKLPGIFANCPTGHMFEVGAYSILDRFGTFVYKGGQFAVVGFLAGLVGTFLSTSLLNARKKMDPDFVIQNASPPTLLNAATWAVHMGLSSNARYQSINGLEFALAKALPAGVFKTLVFMIRGLNNVVGGTSFVILARLTGSQPRERTPPPKEITEDGALEHEKTS